MSRILLSWIFILCSAYVCYGQSSFSISGIVRDDKGTLPGAGVYLSGYKFATVADNDGKFVIPNLKPGTYDVLIQVIGYLPQTKHVIISDKSEQIIVLLKENVTQLNEVVIKADPDRPKYLQIFRDCFIGKTPNSLKCKILNPEVIQAEYDKQRKILRVTANEFLIVENKALGYRIKYLLDYFENNENTNIIFYSGHPTFEDLKGSAAKRRNWAKMRKIAYIGSPQHFFKSLFENKIKEEGFIINKLVKVPNKSRLPDSLINKKLRQFSTSMDGVHHIAPALNDSLNFWLRRRKVPLLVDFLNRSEVLTDTLVRQRYLNLKTIDFADALYIIYTKETESDAFYNTSGHWVSRPLDIGNYEISVVRKLIPSSVSFYQNGGIYDPKSLLFEGFWAYEKVADMVPMDYSLSGK